MQPLKLNPKPVLRARSFEAELRFRRTDTFAELQVRSSLLLFFLLLLLLLLLLLFLLP
jgi:hypothetical protein